MSDIRIRTTGKAGRITLARPQVLNAMTYEMCLAIEQALDTWRADPAISVVVIDAEGDRAFCSGGDIAELYETGKRGDYAYGQKFWADEYRLNYKISGYPKPVVSFLQGLTMGGGVGIGCHGSHRIVGDSSQIAMPECGIGLVPDVGGTFILGRAPGRVGAYLGTTGTRMGAADAIYARFADVYVAESDWPELIETLDRSGDIACIGAAATIVEKGQLEASRPIIDRLFAPETLAEITTGLRADTSEFAAETLKKLRRSSPLSTACALDILRRFHASDRTMADALALEYRFTARAAEHGDFLEGIRAAIIDKDRAPKWQFADGDVPLAAVRQMLAPLKTLSLNLES